MYSLGGRFRPLQCVRNPHGYIHFFPSNEKKQKLQHAALATH